MSRFVQRSRLAAFGILSVMAVSGPALADAVPLPPAEGCTIGSSRAAPGCRVAVRNARRHPVLRTMVEPRRLPILAESRETFAQGRYASLLILGVGY